jgi:glycosyltransferase involved in cell wall biosynthesis
MAGLAVALARLGCRVTYVAEESMSAERAKQGWIVPALPGVDLVYAARGSSIASLLHSARPHVVHICQGMRANGSVAVVQRELSVRGLRQWVVMETVDDTGWYGALKRAGYSRLVRASRAWLQGVLATGHRTADWVAARGMPAESVYPFAYFLPDPERSVASAHRDSSVFRFIFAGRLIPLKRVDWLLGTLGELADPAFELQIVGAGAEEPALRTLAERLGVSGIRWLGQLPLSEVPAVMAQADCLVLPSVHDGWGAVASEALMTGTPVVCSDACGVAGAVQASGVGGVFAVNDQRALLHLLTGQMSRGKVTDGLRRQIADWATCLGAAAGAAYLLKVLDYQETGKAPRPVAPWLEEKRPCAA